MMGWIGDQRNPGYNAGFKRRYYKMTTPTSRLAPPSIFLFLAQQTRSTHNNQTNTSKHTQSTRAHEHPIFRYKVHRHNYATGDQFHSLKAENRVFSTPRKTCKIILLEAGILSGDVRYPEF
jgi:hypothetical protein